MRKRMVVLSFAMMSMLSATTVLFGADMFFGTWKTNIAKSTYKPGPAPKNPQTVKMTAIANGVIVEIDNVTDVGQKAHLACRMKFDSKDYPVKAQLDGKLNPDAPDTISAKKVNDYTIEFTAKQKGKVLVNQKEVVSKDGKTLTVTSTQTNAQGQDVNSTFVYDKQ